MNRPILKIAQKTDDSFSYDYCPANVKRTRMVFFAEDLRRDYFQLYKLDLAVLNTTDVGLLIRRSDQRFLAVIFLDVNDVLNLEIFPGMANDAELQKFTLIVEETISRVKTVADNVPQIGKARSQSITACNLTKFARTIRSSRSSDHFDGWKAVAFERFRIAILKHYNIPVELLIENKLGMLFDKYHNLIGMVDVDETTNHYLIIPNVDYEKSTLLKDIFAAIEDTATEISQGRELHSKSYQPKSKSYQLNKLSREACKT